MHECMFFLSGGECGAGSGGREKGEMKGGINVWFFGGFFNLVNTRQMKRGGGTLINNQCLLAKQYQDN